MKRVFADTWYWIALANPRDQDHDDAVKLSERFGPFRTITSDEVLSEFLAFFSDHGRTWRETACGLVQAILRDPNVQVLPQTRNSFQAGFQLYEQRPDKEYSLVDCITMQRMRDEGIDEVLTGDKHFVQEGFSAAVHSARK